MPDRHVSLPLKARLIVDGDESPSSNRRQFTRENPANISETVTQADEATIEDTRAAIDSARAAFDSNRESWVSDYKL